MCCVSFASSESASNCISGRARRSFSHGLGGCNVAQPVSVSVSASKISSGCLLIRSFPQSATRKKRANLILDHAFSVIAEAYFDVDNGPVRIDQIGARHALNRVRLRRSTLVIVDHGEAGGIDLKKLLRVGTAPIDVDGDNGKAAVTVTLLHLIHPRERSSTRRAPRSPKIDVYDSAPKIRERHRLAVSGHKRKRRRRLADLRGAR